MERTMIAREKAREIADAAHDLYGESDSKTERTAGLLAAAVEELAKQVVVIADEQIAMMRGEGGG